MYQLHTRRIYQNAYRKHIQRINHAYRTRTTIPTPRMQQTFTSHTTLVPSIRNANNTQHTYTTTQHTYAAYTTHTIINVHNTYTTYNNLQQGYDTHTSSIHKAYTQHTTGLQHTHTHTAYNHYAPNSPIGYHTYAQHKHNTHTRGIQHTIQQTYTRYKQRTQQRATHMQDAYDPESTHVQ